jgi:hypothetical protein
MILDLIDGAPIFCLLMVIIFVQAKRRRPLSVPLCRFAALAALTNLTVAVHRTDRIAALFCTTGVALAAVLAMVARQQRAAGQSTDGPSR